MKKAKMKILPQGAIEKQTALRQEPVHNHHNNDHNERLLCLQGAQGWKNGGSTPKVWLCLSLSLRPKKNGLLQLQKTKQTNKQITTTKKNLSSMVD